MAVIGNNSNSNNIPEQDDCSYGSSSSSIMTSQHQPLQPLEPSTSTLLPPVKITRCDSLLQPVPLYSSSATVFNLKASTSTRNQNDAQMTSTTTFNDSNHSILAQDLLGDVLIAATVTAAMAPSLTSIDQALVQKAAGTHGFVESMQLSLQKMVAAPAQYLKSPTFLFMWSTYMATYAAANVSQTLQAENKERRLGAMKEDQQNNKNNNKTINNKTPFHMDPAAASTMAFLATTAANSTAALCKDRAYAKLFGGANQTAMKVPAASYGLWLCRDFTVIGSSFVLPPIVATHLDDIMGKQQPHDNSNVSSSSATPSAQSLAVAQFLTPLTAQIIAGPLHYMGLDYATRPQATLPQRLTHLRQGLSSVIPARMVRILPGYGVAGVWNQRLRTAWKEHVRNQPPANMTGVGMPSWTTSTTVGNA